MSTVKSNKQALLKDELTVDFLHRSYSNYKELTEEMALSEIHSIELAMPVFNTLATLNKSEFNKCMTQLLQHKHSKDAKLFTVMVACIVDTFTCMIQNNRFYGCYETDNKNGLQLMIRLVQSVKYLAVYYKVLGNKELKVFIDMIEKSAQRIQNQTEYYKVMKEILQTLRNTLVNIENKENNFEKPDTEITETYNNNHVKNTPYEIQENSILNENMKLKSNCDANCVTSEIEKPKINPIGLVTTELPHLFECDDSNAKKKHVNNAFDIMMMSSKAAIKKRKLTV